MNNRDPVKRMKVLLLSLPKSDIVIAQKYLNNRDFESLQLLVNSAIVRVKKGLSKEVVKEEYLNADLKKMNNLKLEVDAYCDALDITRQEDFDSLYNDSYY